MSHHIVEVTDLRYTYPDGTPALRGLSFRIVHGESVALVGSNGAGKSTLLLHLNVCLTPAAGKVRIGDFPLTSKTLPHVRRTVGMVFQDPDDQLFMPLVHDDVAFGPLNLGLSPEDVEAPAATSSIQQTVRLRAARWRFHDACLSLFVRHRHVRRAHGPAGAGGHVQVGG